MEGIYVPSTPPIWCAPHECLWKGPPFITIRPLLQDIYCDSPGAEQLFVELLGIPDASYQDVLLEIRQFQRNGQCSEALVYPHYNILSDMCKDEATKLLIQ
jgi:hypothetical protein